MSDPVVVLAGGTGGAKLARGMLDVVAADELVVVANTGDDLEIYGGYVSPDPDLVTFWLADRIDDRGWGLRDDTFAVMEGLRDLGADVWFNLGDRDLAVAVQRARLLAEGQRLTEAQATIAGAFGVAARVLPMSDGPVRTRVLARGRWWSFQEFMIRGRAEGPVDGVEFAGARAARASAEVMDALGSARAIVIGPSNPVISISPMLALQDLLEGMRAAPAAVVAVSPVVRGAVLKPATVPFMRWAGHPVTSAGIAGFYAGLIDGLVADELVSDLPTFETDVLMEGPDGRRQLARQVLEFALALR
ncbi:MAG: YvcK family protein [Solirubrobacterales bacterium]|nr:YvcK family protein [Solirubrobacterales bacterium]